MLLQPLGSNNHSCRDSNSGGGGSSSSKVQHPPDFSNFVVIALWGASLGPQPCEAEAGQKEPSSGVVLRRDCKCLLC